MPKPARFLFCLAVLLSVKAQASTLLDVFYESMASDPRLQRAEAETAIYQARKDNSRGALLPQVSLAAVGTRTARDSTVVNSTTQTEVELPREYYDGERYSATLSQPLYDKQRWEAFRASSKEAEQYGARFDETRGEVAVDVVDRYTQVLAAEDNLAFVSAERTAAEKQLNQARARHERQLARITDVLALEARVNVLLSQELDAENQVAMARENMSEVLGREVDEPLASLREDIIIDWQIGSLPEWIETGLRNNSELEASLLAVEAAERRVKEAAGQRHPKLSISLNAQQSDIGFENAQTPESETYVAAVNFSMPIYTGGQISAQVEETKARLRYARQQHVASDRLVRKEVREAYLNAQSAIERVTATKKAVESAQKSFEAQQKGYEYGTVTVVDVLNASETLYEARRDHRRAYYDLMNARTSLYQVAGEFSAKRIAFIDGWLELPGAGSDVGRIENNKQVPLSGKPAFPAAGG